MLPSDLVLLDDHERAVVRDRDARRGSQLDRRLGDGGQDPSAVAVPHRPFEERLLVGRGEVSPFGLELIEHRVVDPIVDQQVAVGRAARAVVRGLRQARVARRFDHVGGLVDDHRGVAPADSERRLAGAVGGLDHRRPTGRQGQVALRHQPLRQRDRWLLDALEDDRLERPRAPSRRAGCGRPRRSCAWYAGAARRSPRRGP